MRYICGNIADMKIEFKLLRAKKETLKGFPLVVEISHQGKRKQRTICFCKDNQFSEDSKMITAKHPDYDIIAPVMMELKIKAKKISLSFISDVDVAFGELFKISNDGIEFIVFANSLILEMELLADNFGRKNDISSRNKLLGNVKVYQNVINQAESFLKHKLVIDIDYTILMQFRNYQLGNGNKKLTVHQYLRTLRAIYNKAILRYGIIDKKPFMGVFDGLNSKSYQNKKKSISKEDIWILEQVKLKGAKQQYLNLFLLQFYFGGCDLIDLYYMKKHQVKNGRIYFERGKTNTGLLIDLAVHEKAAALLTYFNNESEWLIPGKKEKKSYETYRGRYAKTLIEVQNECNIAVLPTGGNLGSKVARHSFATIAKNLNIEPDLIRELMGHERDEVDNYYKDKYPEKVRDEALYKIID